MFMSALQKYVGLTASSPKRTYAVNGDRKRRSTSHSPSPMPRATSCTRLDEAGIDNGNNVLKEDNDNNEEVEKVMEDAPNTVLEVKQVEKYIQDAANSELEVKQVEKYIQNTSSTEVDIKSDEKFYQDAANTKPESVDNFKSGEEIISSKVTILKLTISADVDEVDIAAELATARSCSQERDSPIAKHYPQLKNPCFVTCVNSALCS
jgi:hypothetical protein